MGVAELRTAFNEIAEPRFTASRATLAYERFEGAEYQRLTFSGVDADGVPFTVASERLPAAAEVLAASRDTARALLTREPTSPPPEPPS